MYVALTTLCDNELMHASRERHSTYYVLISLLMTTDPFLTTAPSASFLDPVDKLSPLGPVMLMTTRRKYRFS